MKLRTSFSILSNPLKDIDHIHDFTYELPQKKEDSFWEQECKLYPSKPTCKLYEV